MFLTVYILYAFLTTSGQRGSVLELTFIIIHFRYIFIIVSHEYSTRVCVYEVIILSSQRARERVVSLVCL